MTALHCRRRAGSSLLEITAALPLIAIIGVVSVQLLLAAHRHVVRTDGALAASRELRQAANIVSADLRVLRSADLVAWSDTLLEFDAEVAVGIVCAVDVARRTVMIVGGTPSDPLTASFSQTPQDGDAVAAFGSDVPARPSFAVPLGSLRSVSTSRACDASPLAAAGEAIAVSVVDSLAIRPAIGLPLRITRRARYSLYRGSDGDWYLGRRSRSATAWDIVQPVAGPLIAARQGGLRFEALDQFGNALARPDSTRPTTRVDITLRAPRRVGRASPTTATTDSLRVTVALRADRGDTP